MDEMAPGPTSQPPYGQGRQQDGAAVVNTGVDTLRRYKNPTLNVLSRSDEVSRFISKHRTVISLIISLQVVLLQSGPLAGKIAVIVEIIDHNRVSEYGGLSCVTLSSMFRTQAIIDGPLTSVPRQAFSYRHLSLTPFRLAKLPRGAGSGCVRRQLEKEGIVAKWENSSWAKKRAAIEKRRSLNDFQRFEVMLAKKARRDAVRKAVAKA